MSEAEFFAVIRTTLRGRRVEVWMRDREEIARAEIYLCGDNIHPSSRLAWILTREELDTLEDVLTAP